MRNHLYKDYYNYCKNLNLILVCCLLCILLCGNRVYKRPLRLWWYERFSLDKKNSKYKGDDILFNTLHNILCFYVFILYALYEQCVYYIIYFYSQIFIISTISDLWWKLVFSLNYICILYIPIKVVNSFVIQ